jgi:spermidine synthase
VRRLAKPLLFAVFGVTGFSALTLQVVWQRVISMHAGVDLYSVTTVVSAFLAGLGLGSLLGGVVADRLGPRRSLLAFAASNAAIGAFAWASLWLFYDLYREVASHLVATAASFAFHFLLLVVPTLLMGLSLPLVARGVVATIEEAGSVVGRLYGVNTIGAGVGAAVSGWVLLGTFGFEGAVRISGGLNVLAGLALLTLWRLAPAVQGRADESAPLRHEGRAWPWLVLYGITGAVALGFEIVFFRVVDAVIRPNSYTFAHVLTLYLLLFGAGSALGARFVRHAARPSQTFLWLQFGIAIAALVGVVGFLDLPGVFGMDDSVTAYFSGDGFTTGGYERATRSDWLRLLFAHGIGPLLVMGPPVLLMGASFPFVQALVSEQVGTLGRRTGLLLFVNIAGNVAGTLLTGFLLIEALGTAGTYRLLASLLVVAGIAAAVRTVAAKAVRLSLATAAVAVFGVMFTVFPTNERLWAHLHAASGERFRLVEDRACVTAMKQLGDQHVLYINGSSQNGYPYDDFHVLIGLLPALLQRSPERGLAIGLGIGGTPYGMMQDPRIRRVDAVEICGTEVDLLEDLAREASFETSRLLDDPRLRIHVGDGRKFLLSTDRRYDIVTVDTLRAQAAYSGNLYSVEFYELVRDRLTPDGLFTQWVATQRTLNSVTEVFPHVVTFAVPSYQDSRFLVASERPIAVDVPTMLERLAAIDLDRSFSPEQARSLAEYVATASPESKASASSGRLPGEALNHDLAPRDEYFLNNSLVDVERRRRATARGSPRRHARRLASGRHKTRARRTSATAGTRSAERRP